jgi:hypothetical protein
MKKPTRAKGAKKTPGAKTPGAKGAKTPKSGAAKVIK